MLAKVKNENWTDSSYPIEKPKIKVNAEEAVRDIRAGMPDTAIMKKYGLSARGLQSLFKKLGDAEFITSSELKNRSDLRERSVTLQLYRCPACNMPQFYKFDECPQCGVIVSKFLKVPIKGQEQAATLSFAKKARRSSAVQEHPPTTIRRTVTASTRRRRRLHTALRLSGPGGAVRERFDTDRPGW